MIAGLARDLTRLILPNACVVCGQAGSPDLSDHAQLLCRLCRSRLQPLVGGCRRCAQPLPVVGPCRFCAEWDSLAAAHSAVWLDPPARRMVHGLKYAGTRALARAMATVIQRHVPRPDGVLVPVPLGARRLAARGYNQALLLAAALGAAWDLPVEAGLIRRIRDTRTQTALDPAARLTNVTGAFGVGAEAATRVGKGGDATVILIDDVLTTGATLLAAAVALRASGCGRVRAVTFARAEPWVRRITDGIHQTSKWGMT